MTDREIIAKYDSDLNYQLRVWDIFHDMKLSVSNRVNGIRHALVSNLEKSNKELRIRLNHAYPVVAHRS